MKKLFFVRLYLKCETIFFQLTQKMNDLHFGDGEREMRRGRERFREREQKKPRE